MAANITLTMIKPTAVNKGFIGPVLAMINRAGFRIVAVKYLKLSESDAQSFYEVHKEKHFYNDLIKFMSSGPIIAAILEKENAVEAYRELIGATDPAKAADGTVRKYYGTSIEANAVHGSDSDENAKVEADFFFAKSDRLDYM